MRLSLTLVLLLAILVGGVCIAGCTTSTPQSVPAATTPATPVPASSSGANQSEPVSLLFVQESPSASLVPAGNGTYTLTLRKIVPYTTYFSDRPDRIAGLTPMEEFIAGFNWSVAPNAAITRIGARESEDTMIVELSNPRYNAAANEMIYTVTVISNSRSDKLKELAAKSDSKLPTDLGKVSLFIDSQPAQKNIAERPMY